MFKKTFLILFLLTLAMQSVSAEQTVWLHESKDFNTTYTDDEVKQIYKEAYMQAVRESWELGERCGYQMWRTVELVEEQGVRGYMMWYPEHVIPLVKLKDGTYYGLQYLKEFTSEEKRWGERKVNYSWRMKYVGSSKSVSITKREGTYARLNIEYVSLSDIMNE